MVSELSSTPRVLLGVAIAACVGLIGFLVSGSAPRRAAPPAGSTEWAAPSRTARGDPLRPAGAPPQTSALASPGAPAPTSAQVAARALPLPVLHLQGDVFLQDGTAAAGARIVVGRHRERCDSGGHYDFTLASVPEDADLVAFLTGYEPARITRYGARFAAGATSDHVRLVLGPNSRCIAGTVVDGEGRPHKNWLVELAGDDPLAVAVGRDAVKTDAQGRFRVPDVPAGWFALRVRRSPHDEGFVTQEFEAGTEQARVVLLE